MSNHPLLHGAALAALLMCAAPSAYGESPAEEIAETIAEASQLCRNKGGKPDTAGVLTSEDWSGDGKGDWIADFSRLKCEGADNPACNPNGCMLQLYLASGDGWDLVFEDFARSYKFSDSGDSRIMHVTTSGIPCNKPAEDICRYNYRLDQDGVTPVR